MATCPGRGHSRRVCSVTGLGGVALATGDVITGEANLRAVSMQNGLVRITYELPSGAEPAACHLFINGGHTSDGHEDVWSRCFRPGYGDWTFFITPTTTTADRIVVIEASDDAVELSLEWTSKSLDNAAYSSQFDGGLTSRDYARNAIFPSSSVVPRRIETVHLRKVIRMVRGVQGYWLSWRSDPNVVPMITEAGAAANNEANLGEREFGTGGGTAVAWASTGKVGHFPAWREQRDWSAVTTALPSFDNFAWWPGIDDPTYPSWNHATVIAMQPDGFPAEQTTGPWYVADIPKANYGGDPNVLRVLVQKNPNQVGVWQFSGQLGEVVNHYTNHWTESDGRHTRFTVFIGADHCTPDATAAAKAGYTGDVAYANEPSATAQDLASKLVTAAYENWPT